jgi:NAD(P)-dependent dehydrogenase (short-subunit alcohol dehydrogenase family)
VDDAATPALRGAIVGGEIPLASAIRRALADTGISAPGGIDEAGALDVLVVIAKDAAGPIAETSADTFSDALGGELRSAFVALQDGVAAMRAKGGGGSVVFVAPAQGRHRAFDTLQQGLRLMARAAALELGPEGIRVNVVLPGAGEGPLGRACTPADIAAGVAFAASDRAHFMTGADLAIDGGRLAQ